MIWRGAVRRRQLPESPANTQRGPLDTVFTSCLCVSGRIYVLKNGDHGFLCRCAVRRLYVSFPVMWKPQSLQILFHLPPERRGTSEELQSGGVSSAEQSTLSFGGSFFVSTCHTQLSVQVPEEERVLQSPTGPFYTLNEEANHFTRVSRHPNATETAMMTAMIIVIILFCLQ